VAVVNSYPRAQSAGRQSHLAADLAGVPESVVADPHKAAALSGRVAAAGGWLEAEAFPAAEHGAPGLMHSID